MEICKLQLKSREPFQYKKIIALLNKCPETETFIICFTLGKEYLEQFSGLSWFFHSFVHSFIEPIFNESDYGLSTVLCTCNTKVNKTTHKEPCPSKTYILTKRDRQGKTNITKFYIIKGQVRWGKENVGCERWSWSASLGE